MISSHIVSIVILLIYPPFYTKLTIEVSAAIGTKKLFDSSIFYLHGRQVA
jgi:hypothetical protein